MPHQSWAEWLVCFNCVVDGGEAGCNWPRELYRESTDLIDALLSKVPTPTVERRLLRQLGEVYAGYFASLSNRDKNREAFAVMQRAGGRVEAQALEDHEPVAPHKPTTAEKPSQCTEALKTSSAKLYAAGSVRSSCHARDSTSLEARALCLRDVIQQATREAAHATFLSAISQIYLCDCSSKAT